MLDRYGLADLTMRRLATELGVQPSALYHHFPNKQALLAAVADEVLRRGRRGEAGCEEKQQGRDGHGPPHRIRDSVESISSLAVITLLFIS